ncbi:MULTISPECIES: methylaspartate ammonia-lyase [unclassified Candidatus Frackibacter]|uniref:methylaspartate ammonia-lyase n=1 Tax=unclassified Candidatus Frackibacter TaxID=2648818 RepID=UPI000791BB12|nr:MULTISPECIES: methylaspartate ammonia-lyase [unclassified Candidatus Frackibacter]KXS43961.1 MAG: methylaspartate ammonia-lyase [Candidatus Frackibacter sp. T328-2]SDC75554.1 methylaspartate ammonia-lyase [Candidatus Frackibacter sp. WG11]SEM89238.1 methylaspartate ammonia-lyase [Candidatus Frackibacter sp. WG12]SFL98672.1 methylaspartate ammonia-lyase [Candidatus Frackibacter sp. WG13]
MKIKEVLTSPGLTGFYFDDQKAIKEDAEHDGLAYVGEPLTEGFSSVRQAGESISIMIILEDGQVAYGDCAAVQYSGVDGRDPLFLAEEFIPIIEKKITPKLVGRELDSFKDLAEEFDNFKIDGKRLHTAIRYGLTQALLDAVAKAKKRTMTEIVAEEYNLKLTTRPVPIFTQTGDERYMNADKMIIKHADVMPHALINNVKEKLGEEGEKLLEYIKWLKDRVQKLKNEEDYQPIFHIDVYGTLGLAFDNNPGRMADYLERLAEVAKPHALRVEGPMDSGSRKKQIEDMKVLKAKVKERGIAVELVADEWCNTLEDIKLFVDEEAADVIQIKTPDLGGINNTIEAVLYCKKNGIGAYQGGTCNETERSAQVCVNLALATRPDQMLAKPGMGVDEGLMIVKNEMERVLSLLRARRG